MAIDDDKEELLDALYTMVQDQPGKRPSIWEAQMQLLPDWDRDRLFEAATALEQAGDILNPTPGVINVDLSSGARRRAATRAVARASPHHQTINIQNAFNSPIQQVGSGGSGVQNVAYKIDKQALQDVLSIYHRHVDELGLSEADRRRADAQVGTIEAQMLDDPDPGIVKVAGGSLKSIVEGALGGALGNVITNAAVWAPLLALF